MPARTVDISRISRTTLLLTATGTALAWLLEGPRAGLSLAGGGLLVVANLGLIRAIVSRLITRSADTKRGVGLVVLKLLAMVAVVAAAFSGLPIDAAPFSIGVSTLLIAMVLDACWLGEPVGS